MPVEKYTLKQLKELIENGKNYKLLKPFLVNNQVFINVEKILTPKDIQKLEDKIYGEIEVLPAVAHEADNQVLKFVISGAIEILKHSSLFKVNDVHHLDFEKRKECEKILTGIISRTPHLADYLLKLYRHSKKLFIHSINVAIIATVIDLGIQQKHAHHDGLRTEVLLTASLLHDIGFLFLPKSMTEKRRIEYSDEEKSAYLKYPAASKKIALSLGDEIRKKSAEVICQHRERLTGDGFPDKMKGSQIDELALIIGIADEFDLMIAGEMSTSQKSPSEVMSRMSRMGGIFGEAVVDSFYTWFRYLK